MSGDKELYSDDELSLAEMIEDLEDTFPTDTIFTIGGRVFTFDPDYIVSDQRLLEFQSVGGA